MPRTLGSLFLLSGTKNTEKAENQWLNFVKNLGHKTNQHPKTKDTGENREQAKSAD